MQQGEGLAEGPNAEMINLPGFEPMAFKLTSLHLIYLGNTFIILSKATYISKK